MSRSKAKGTAAETAVVRYLQDAGFVQVERRALNGGADRGDIAGIPSVVIEVKNCARQELPAWVAEAELERDNDGASLGVVWHKRRGKADPADWFVTMSGAQFAALLREQQGLPAPATEGEDTCRPFEVDGEVVSIRGNGDFTEQEREFAAEIIRAAKRKFEAEHSAEDGAA